MPLSKISAKPYKPFCTDLDISKSRPNSRLVSATNQYCLPVRPSAALELVPLLVEASMLAITKERKLEVDLQLPYR